MSFPIAKEGLPAIFLFTGITFILIPFSLSVALAMGLFTLFTLYFFREPKHPQVQIKPNEFLSPSYGTVVQIAPSKANSFFKGKGVRVSIFLSVFDVHINYAPSSGVVEHLKYEKGKFLNALNPKSAESNECNWIGISAEKGPILVKQIAGLIARRIVCSLHHGGRLVAGQRIGLIQFGSRVDIWLPDQTKILVEKGDRVKGGVTIIGECP